MTREEKEKIVRAIAEKASRNLIDFATFTFPTYKTAKHLDFVADKLEAVERGEIKKLMIFMPPRHGKSELASVRFPAWYLGRHPDDRIILASYGAELSQKFSREIRDEVEDEKYGIIFDSIRTSADSRAKNRWDIENRRGGMLAVGVCGGATGHGANIFITDDPIKNMKEAESETYRNSVWDWYSSVVRTRLEPDARQILILTRWHKDDVAGRLLDSQKDWVVVNLPARAEENDAIGRKPGEALWPWKYNEEALAQIEDDVGSRIWSGLYQGRPQDPKSQIIKRDWIRWIDKTPPDCVRVGGIDTASKTKEINDSTSLVDICIDKEGWLYVDDVFCDKVTVKTFADHIINRHKVKTYSKIHIEENNAGEAFRQRVVEEGLKSKTYPPITGFNSDTDKTVRLMEIQPLIENGTIKFVKGNAKVAQLVDNLVGYPQAKCDDDVDALGFAVKAASTGIISEDDIALSKTKRDLPVTGTERENVTDLGMDD